ncbi:MAG: glycosyltransferase family 39 protein [Candidatus Peribacteraceae bacterium]|jgi:4-amino-4-deoxy-L-arabinose transferase-like glycosyltransferase
MKSPLPFPKGHNVFLGLAGFCLLLVLLVWPAFQYPIISDTVLYAMLGKSVWLDHTYMFEGVPFAKHLPLHAMLSFPLTALFGMHGGMKISSLLAGWGVLLATFLLVRRAFSSELLALLASAFVLLHPGFIFMAMVGSADLLFTMLFLLSLWAYLEAAEDRRWYVACGVFTGLACLTRYNGFPLFPLFFLSVLAARRTDLRSPWFWGGMAAGAALLSLWFLRNALTFGSPFATGYVGELQKASPNLWRQFWSNLLYYANPIHNVFPFLFPFALYGLFRYGRRYPFLVAAMLAAWPLTAIWWVQAIRFAFPGYVILLGFTALALRDLWRLIRPYPLAVAVLLFLALPLQGTALCLYTYGQCNAAFDRTFGFLPRDMGLSTEGFAAWDEARIYINAHVGNGAVVVIPESPTNGESWTARTFRADLRVIAESTEPCVPSYRITQKPFPTEEVVFTSSSAPEHRVVLQRCP